jgi:hypothetical protein
MRINELDIIVKLCYRLGELGLLTSKQSFNLPQVLNAVSMAKAWRAFRYGGGMYKYSTSSWSWSWRCVGVWRCDSMRRRR